MLTTAKWTIQDYHRIIKSGVLADRQVELINGDIVEMAPEGEPRAYCSDEAGEYLTYLLGDRAKVLQGKPITLPNNNSEPQPDLAIVQRLGREYLEHHPYPENIFWLIEYSDSSLKKDLEAKAKLYASVGIPEYWVINLRKMELTVFRIPSRDGYHSEQMLTDVSLSPLAFPDIKIESARLLKLD